MLLWASLVAVASLLESIRGAQLPHSKRSPPPCDQRCRKIFDKTLQRVSYSFDAIEKMAGRLAYFDDRLVKEVCWRAFDFLHCMEHCEEPEKRSFLEMRNALETSCQERAAAERTSFSCISRYHNFLEIHCSSYMNEAIAQQNVVIFDDDHRHLMCRYLREHQQCLVTNVAQFCPQATHLFIEENLSDYFPTFVADSGERYLDEKLVDDCRNYRFHFELKPIEDSRPRLILTPPPNGRVVPDSDQRITTTIVTPLPEVVVVPDEIRSDTTTSPPDDSNSIPETGPPIFPDSLHPETTTTHSPAVALPPDHDAKPFTPPPDDMTESPTIVAPVVVHVPTFFPYNQDDYEMDQERDQTDRTTVIATYLLISIVVFIVLLLLLVVLFGRVIRRILDTLISELID